MSKERILSLLFVVICVGLFQLKASAQGGWRQWDIHLTDGTTVQASPLALKNGRFTRSMSDKESGIERSKIAYISAVANSLPPVPTGKFKKDLIILLDGTRSFGRVTFKKIKFSEGTIVQNGKKMTLQNVAYIIFSRYKKITGSSGQLEQHKDGHINVSKSEGDAKIFDLGGD